jgi:hypothetical protein
MKKLVALAAAGVLLSAAVPAFAGAQQDKMKNCNKEAAEKALKGDERKAFMKECLSTKAEAAPAEKKTAQQEKMKNCNKEAADKALKGDERKKFMSSCLKG